MITSYKQRCWVFFLHVRLQSMNQHFPNFELHHSVCLHISVVGCIFRLSANRFCFFSRHTFSIPFLNEVAKNLNHHCNTYVSHSYYESCDGVLALMTFFNIMMLVKRFLFTLISTQAHTNDKKKKKQPKIRGWNLWLEFYGCRQKFF